MSINRQLWLAVTVSTLLALLGGLMESSLSAQLAQKNLGSGLVYQFSGYRGNAGPGAISNGWNLMGSVTLVSSSSFDYQNL